MIFNLENGVLTTDLDCQFHNLLNLNALVPTPPGLVGDSDPRLTDQRVPVDGSVTNIKVAAAAGIVQSKLLLNGVIPATWLGTTSTTAAQGNLAEYVSRKGAINGYASLDGTGKIPVAQLPALAGMGTVTNFSAGDCNPLFTTTESNPTTTPALTFNLTSAPANSWFGNSTGVAGAPAYRTGAIPVGLIPNLDAAVITSGIFNSARIPLAVYGPGSHSGAMPSPGALVAGTETDTLCRDLSFRPTPTSAKVNVITTTGSGTFNTDAGVRAVFVELWGGGGGGAYCSKWITVIQGSYNVSVGNGGNGGSAGGGDGAAGQATSWQPGTGGPVANGGLGGTGDPAGATLPGVVRIGASGGNATGADLGMSSGDGGGSAR